MRQGEEQGAEWLIPKATDIVIKPKEKAMNASVCFFISFDSITSASFYLA
jgi:hypothetical protein